MTLQISQRKSICSKFSYFDTLRNVSNKDRYLIYTLYLQSKHDISYIMCSEIEDLFYPNNSLHILGLVCLSVYVVVSCKYQTKNLEHFL